MVQAMPLDKTHPFINIVNWSDFKEKLISEFGGIPIFAHKAQILPVYESVQEVAPKLKNLESLIVCVNEYHPVKSLQNTVLTLDLNS